MPELFVLMLAFATLPPPAETPKLTVTFATGLPFASLTTTLGGIATAVPAVAV
jgi:hypothetical protein